MHVECVRGDGGHYATVLNFQGKLKMADDKALKILPFLAPYAILICVLYLFGYWSSFGINILEFISFSDVVN
jgi:hypothetical protein